jgi:hypothetical protein
MTKKPSKAWRALRLGLSSSVLVGVCTLFAGACGKVVDTPPQFGGESHFLRHCSETCGDGLDCISGVCTRGCVVEQQNSCAAFAGASCTSDSFEPGAVAVCDVKCSGDADCSALGGDYGCEAGFCRAPELVADGRHSPADAGAEPLDCPQYRSRPGETQLAVVVRNERSTPVYLQPAKGCNDSVATLVNFERAGQEVNLRGGFPCGTRGCDSFQDNGFVDPIPCNFSCQLAPQLLRLEPGAEIDGGQTWTEFVGYGTPLSTAPQMPDSCIPGERAAGQLPATGCYAQIPLPSGAYRITAQAFLGIECPPGSDCDCSDASGSCTVGSQSGAGDSLIATADVRIPASTVTVTFRDE